MSREASPLRSWLDSMAVVLAIGLVSGCGGQASGESDSGGTLVFKLDRGVSVQLPITFCTGFGTVLTVVGRKGDTQVEARIIENTTMRGGEPLELSTVSGYRTTGEEDGRRYEEQWQSRSHQAVKREGAVTRITGTMYGQRFYATSETAFGPPQPIDSGRDFGFTLEAQCAQ
jgi:hypothetical protein